MKSHTFSNVLQRIFYIIANEYDTFYQKKESGE